jgi:FAD/FMN-containing dehydrogenase
MRAVCVDGAARVAHVQGGATWGDVDGETQRSALATPGGGVSSTGVAGLMLNGGIGRLRGRYRKSLYVDELNDALMSAEAEGGEALVRAAFEPSHERLVRIKNRYDPDSLFRLNQNIRRAGT